MDAPKKQDLPSGPQAAEEEVIDLTEILEEGASETVIEISSKVDELDSLDLKALLSQGGESEPHPDDKEGEEASLEDLLSSLKESPDEPLAAPEPEPEPELELEPIPEPELEPVPEPEPPPAAAAPAVAEVREQVRASLSEDQIRQIVREVVLEISERLCRELFPEVASQVVSREIEALKKSLEEEI